MLSNFNQYNQINLDVQKQVLTPINPTAAGSNDQQQQIPVAVVAATTDNSVSNKKNSKWIAPSSVRYCDAQKTQEDRHNDLFRRCRGLLNKLTPEKFEKLSFDLLNIGIDSPNVLKGIILLIFEKSLAEPNYCGLYAELCLRLDKDAPNFEPAGSAIKTFRRLLLAKCEYEFENRAKTPVQNGNEFVEYEEQQQQSDHQQQPALTASELRIQAKKKAVGNIKFIGELGKLNLVSEAILHKCIKTLLKSGNNESLNEKCEDLECLTKIMQTIGKKLDNEQAKNLMDQYIERIKKFQANKDLPSRIRYILQDVIELRENNWIPRFAQRENETKLNIEESTNIQKQHIQQQQPIFPYPYAQKFQPPSDMMYQMGNRPMRPSFPRQIQNQRQYDATWSNMTQNTSTQRPIAPARLTTGAVSTGIGATNVPLSSDRFQFERLNPLLTGNQQQSSHYQQQQRQPSSSYFRSSQPSVASSTSPKTRGQQTTYKNNSNFNLMNPFETNNNTTNNHRTSPTILSDNKLKTSLEQTNGDKRPSPSTTPPLPKPTVTVVNGSFGDDDNKTVSQPKPFIRPPLTLNGPTSFTPTPRSSAPRPQSRTKSWLPTDREASQMIPIQMEKQQAPQTNRTQISNTYYNTDIVDNHPLTKQQSNLSSLIKTSIPPTVVTSQLQNVSGVSANSLSLDELHEKYDTFLTSVNDIEVLIQEIRCLKLSKRQTIEFGEYILIKSVYNHNRNIDSLCKLLQELYKNGLFINEQCILVISNILLKINDHEKDIPLFKSEFSFILAKLISSSLDEKQLPPPKKQTSSSNCLLSLTDLCKILKDGQYHPLFLLVLQQLQDIYNNNEVYMYNLLEKSKINMSDMLPLGDRKDDLLLNVLEDRRLAYLCPYLKFRCKLTEQLHSNITNSDLETFIDEQTINYNKQDKKFIQTLITCICEAAIDCTTIQTTNIQQRPDKQTVVKEKQEIEKYRQCLQKYITTIDQQVEALYALQLLAYKKQFPKELLLRLFKYSYDFDIIEEDAYYKWKEDINDDYPEKGKALFQVNQWIKWLEGAEEESESDETTQLAVTATKLNDISSATTTIEQQNQQEQLKDTMINENGNEN
ncbi:unnamed protein product [Didymodactylos carnosus]|uniref:Eukaryotic translation initiation factor 4 gamma 2 n=1 Tax=Didymodactylos carnosus TaxID=1234261 RepID=A0A813P9Z1_9BILA|nr:unnamed protein product [Didymodactylos carnosus]CAF0965860.1 unnamed protein product [Didymodactylos carnosus]CAF3526258.1 unnamed protein product [Didymodactylos carnosus]CAF3737747.1 unnamed protein product [Didymodactylos carnosus]